jgi:ubiquinone/menaquinone biosynthesis C-methylase UbiE
VAEGWEEWEWDDTLFEGAAAYYERGRLPNSPYLADAFQDALGLAGTGRLLDVGCGPGTVAIRIAHLFEEVVGIDADDEMVEEARRLSIERGLPHARWVHMRAESLPADLGLFRVVTFAASFHWMDRLTVARTVREMLDPDGVVVHVDNRHQDLLMASTLPAVPREQIDDLRVRYLGVDRRAGASVRNSSPGDEARIFRDAGFEGPDVVVVPDGRDLDRSIDDVVAEVFSMSSTAPHLFGDRKRQFEDDLRQVLTSAASSDGLFGVRLPDNQLNVWRPARP